VASFSQMLCAEYNVCSTFSAFRSNICISGASVQFFWLLLLAKNGIICDLWLLGFQKFEHEGHGFFLSKQIHLDLCLFGFSSFSNNSFAVSNFDLLCSKSPENYLMRCWSFLLTSEWNCRMTLPGHYFNIYRTNLFLSINARSLAT
jgi:hypothetical protein